MMNRMEKFFYVSNITLSLLLIAAGMSGMIAWIITPNVLGVAFFGVAFVGGAAALYCTIKDKDN